MLISIFASIGSHNLGDELILKNEIRLLEEKYSIDNNGIIEKPNFIVFSYDYKNPFFVQSNIEYKEYFPIGLKDKKNIWRNIKNFFVFLNVVFKSKLIVIGGGGLFFDNEVGNKKNPLDLWLFRKTIFNILFKKIYFFKVGLSIKNTDSFLKILNIFTGDKHIVEVRDNYSKKILDDLGIENVIREYDPVFYDNLDLNISKKVSIKKIFKNFTVKDLEGIDFKEKKVGIAFRSGYLTTNLNPELEVLLIKEIIEFIQSSGGSVVLLPHSFHKIDLISNDYSWMKFIQERASNVEITSSMKETYDVYKNRKVDIVLAQRLHSVILSQVYEIPFIGISYSKKTEEILYELK